MQFTPGINFNLSGGGFTMTSAPPTSGTAPTDPDFANVSLLVNAEAGPDDVSTNNLSASVLFGSPTTSGTNVKYGSGSLDLTANVFASYVYPNTNDVFTFDGDFTVELWIFSPAYNDGNAYGVFDFRLNAARGNYLHAIVPSDNTGNIRVVKDITTQITSSTSLTPSVWNHVALVRNSGTVTLYINGVSSGSFVDNTTFIADHFIPSYASGLRNHQYADDIRIVKGVAVYTTDFTPPSELPTSGSTPTDPDFANVTLLLNAEGDYQDKSNDANTVTANAGASLNTSVFKYGTSSLDLVGNAGSDFFSVNPNLNFGTGDFTIEWWMKPDTLVTAYSSGGLATLFDHGAAPDASTDWWAVHMQSNELLVVANGGALSITTSGAGITTDWNHVAIVRSSGTVTVYVNGAAVGSASYSTAFTDSEGRTLTIGFQNGFVTPERFYKGLFDDIRITSGVARYTAPFTPPTETFPTA